MSDVSRLDQLRLEMGNEVNTLLGLEVQRYLTKYEEATRAGTKGAAGWVDQMVLRLTSEGRILPRTVQILAAEVARDRLRRGPRGENLSPVLREILLDLENYFMLALSECGLQHNDAARLTANALHAIHGAAHLASYIQKKFPSYQNTPYAIALAEIVREDLRQPGFKQRLLEYLNRLPDRAPGQRH